MPIFWDYFTKKLQFLPILKAGAAQVLAQGGAGMLDEARSAVLWLRDQFLPELCDDSQLDSWAQSRGITRQAYETDEQYEEKVRFAWAWHLIGGREEALERILEEAAGITDDFEIINMRDLDEERWAEFRIVFENLSGDSMEKFDVLPAAIFKIKPARSKLEGIDMSLMPVEGAFYIGASGIFTGDFTTVFPFGVAGIEVEPCPQYWGCFLLSGDNTAILPYQGEE
ncbi:phage tail protein [uncultured Desulfobacter sp.]|uniref:phage tail protein n=1 Tax=uncultured Desulfobacter sp. TaxID=240139 RepID=UPI002AAB27D7|nr:phage tail protein [uncultured Desulfobacter sp.]